MANDLTARVSLEDALNEVPVAVADFFRRLDGQPEFRVTPLRMQITIHFRDQKAGGFNRSTGEWYISKLLVEGTSGAGVLERHGFLPKESGARHVYWGLRDPESAAAFQAALAEILKRPI